MLVYSKEAGMRPPRVIGHKKPGRIPCRLNSARRESEEIKSGLGTHEAKGRLATPLVKRQRTKPLSDHQVPPAMTKQRKAVSPWFKERS